MASKPDPRAALAAFVVATLLSAAFWWLGSGVMPWWWATWLAPLPVLAYALRASARGAFASAFLAWAIGGFNIVTYLKAVHVPAFPIAMAIVVPALVFAFATLLARALARRERTIAAALALPALWVALEFLNSHTSPHGTMSSIAYTQMDALPVIQIAAVLGAWGIGFLVLLVPSALAAASVARTSAARSACVALAIVPLGAALAYGFLRLHSADAQTISTVKIGLVSVDGAARTSIDDEKGRALIARYVPLLESLAADGATIAVMPETVFETPRTDIPELSSLATQRGMTIVSGVAYHEPNGGVRNLSLAFAPNGGAPTQYAKHHLLPGFEDRYTPGDSYMTIDAPARTGLTICKDMDFPAMGREYAARDAKLLLVPAWDFEIDGWLHSRMAILRGVESGLAIARAARDGVLTLSDDRGRVVAEASSTHIQDSAKVVGSLPLRTTKTVYARFGDGFGWAALAMLVVCLVRLWPLRRPSL